jgi:hypothetical protein
VCVYLTFPQKQQQPTSAQCLYPHREWHSLCVCMCVSAQSQSPNKLPNNNNKRHLKQASYKWIHKNNH